LFCSGHTGFVQRMYAAKGFDRPYAIHATYQYAGTEGKRHRMREAMAWVTRVPGSAKSALAGQARSAQPDVLSGSLNTTCQSARGR
ncbi:MAG: hypothetical protein AAFX85_14195, partial [Pseudomonadota bacterium]